MLPGLDNCCVQAGVTLVLSRAPQPAVLWILAYFEQHTACSGCNVGDMQMDTCNVQFCFTVKHPDVAIDNPCEWRTT